MLNFIQAEIEARAELGKNTYKYHILPNIDSLRYSLLYFLPLNLARADILGCSEAVVHHQVSCTTSTLQARLGESEGAGRLWTLV